MIDIELLTAEESKFLIRALIRQRGSDGYCEEEAAEVLRWAKEARLADASLELVLQGRASLDVKDGEVVIIGKGSNNDV